MAGQFLKLNSFAAVKVYSKLRQVLVNQFGHFKH